jgi:hypothetical protein
MGNVTQAALDSGRGGGGQPSADDVLNSVSAVLQELDKVSGIAAKIDEAALAAVGAITTAQTNAMGAIEGQKAAALQAIEAAKPMLPSRNAAVEESEKYPIIR